MVDTDEEVPVPIIRKDAPVPTAGRGRPVSNRWAFLRDLGVGESALFEFDDYEDLKDFRNLLNSNCSRVARSEGIRFTVRTMPNQREVCVWRLE